MPNHGNPKKYGSCSPSSSAACNIGVVYQPLSALVLNPKNPRLHKPRHVRRIAGSIKAFGFIFPIVTDRYNRIICGHGRYLAAEKLGLVEVPTIRLEHLSEVQMRALVLADNKLTEVGEWSEPLLAQELKALSIVDLGFDLDVTGFDVAEIDLRIESLSAHENSAEDDVPKLEHGPPICRGGDLYKLDEHRLFCGSALTGGAYDQLMQGARAALIVSDPPYNQKVVGHVTGKGSIKHREFPMASGEMPQQQFVGFLRTATTLMSRHSKDGSIHFIFMDWAHIGDLMDATRDVYSELKAVCVWVKNNGGMGSLYRSKHELIFVYKNGRAPHLNNIQLGRFGRNRTNVWEYAGANGTGRTGEENLLELHPTAKPIAMFADAILDCSARGDIVLDPFLGSGTTLLAAQRTGRRCFAMELDPRYVDVAIRRWQTQTGQDALNLTRGKTFNELLAERRGAR